MGRAWLLLLTLGALAGCASETGFSTNDADGRNLQSTVQPTNAEQPQPVENGEDSETIALKMQELEKKMNELTLDKSCQGGDQCKSAAWGAKPCGGPWTHKVYSTRATDDETAAVIAAQYEQLNRKLNDLDGAFSDCAYVMPPTLACIHGTCVDLGRP